MKIANGAIDQHEKLLARVSKAVRDGVADAVDEQRVLSRLEAARARQADAEQVASDAEARYLRLGSARPDAKLILPAALGVSNSLDEAIAAGSGHPTLRLLHGEIQAGVQQALAIDAERGGELALRFGPAGLLHLSSSAANPLTLGAALLSMTLPVYDGGERDYRLKRAISSIDVAMSRREDVQRQISLVVTQAWNAHAAARSNAAHAVRQLQALDKVAAGYEKQHALGSRSIVDILDAENERLAARSREATARYSLLFATYRLSAAQGRLADSLGVVSYREAVLDGETDLSKVLDAR
jgi:adhesin transport system outer membrane protein